MKRDETIDTLKKFENLSQDQIVRRSFRKKDYEQFKQSNKEFDEEERELKKFFEEGKIERPREDPTLVRKRRKQQKKKAYSEISKTANLSSFVTNFFKYEPATPEEIEYLDLCRRVSSSGILDFDFFSVFTDF